MAGFLDLTGLSRFKKKLLEAVYEINEFRRKSTAYNVGDKVDCAFQYERFLECTKAGTTSADLLDTRSVTHGQVIADGTVEWSVRTHVRSVNGNVAGADGNVLVDVGVKTVEGKAPDGNGNVALGLHAVATSGNYNDLGNKPSIPSVGSAMPNYNAGITYTLGNKVSADGWIYAYVSNSPARCDNVLAVNGVEVVCKYVDFNGSRISAFFPVSKGDVVTRVSGSYSNIACKFFPCKG